MADDREYLLFPAAGQSDERLHQLYAALYGHRSGQELHPRRLALRMLIVNGCRRLLWRHQYAEASRPRLGEGPVRGIPWPPLAHHKPY